MKQLIARNLAVIALLLSGLFASSVAFSAQETLACDIVVEHLRVLPSSSNNRLVVEVGGGNFEELNRLVTHSDYILDTQWKSSAVALLMSAYISGEPIRLHVSFRNQETAPSRCDDEEDFDIHRISVNTLI